MKTDLLFAYMKCRAQIEGVAFELGQKDFFEPYFKLGVRIFFGVSVDDDGVLINDEREPESYPGLLDDFINSYKSEK